MIRNYIKVAFRAFNKDRLTAFINIAGLALALTSALLIYLYIQDELRYDQHNRHAARMYRVTRSWNNQEGVTSLHLANVAPPIGPLLKNDFGEIEVLARTLNFFGVDVALEENGEIKMVTNENNVFLCEPEIFKIFDIHVVNGDPEQALDRPLTAMLSEKTALRYFNTTDVLGKRLRFNNTFDLEVTGVYQDFPLQSHWHPDFLVSFSTLNDDNIYGRTNLETNWGNNAFGTYLLLDDGADPEAVQSRFPAFLDKHFSNFAKANYGAPADFQASKSTSLYLQKVTDIHLHSHLDDEIEANGNINTVYLLGVIGLFIILIACFNFVNLSTARATKRAKEVGMRKVSGALRHQLILQYLTESVLIAVFGMLLSLAVASISLPFLNDFVNKELRLFPDPKLILGVIAFSIFVGLLAGVYPAFVISSIRPALMLKTSSAGGGKGLIRKMLVVAQFTISIVLIIATLTTFQQLRYLENQELGYKKDYVITTIYYNELVPQFDAFYNELTKSTLIRDVSRSSRIPTGRLLDSYGTARVLVGDSLAPAGVDLKTISIDESFFSTYGIRIIAGRNFSRSIATDDSLSFMINKTAAQAMGWTNPSEHINEDFEYAGMRGKLIGIVDDFHFESLHQPIAPMIFLQSRNNYNVISYAINGERSKEALDFLEKKWKEFLPARPYNYNFISEQYRQLYESEQRQSSLFIIFSCLAIFIASLGLLGLATFNTMQRVKEIGIRKVLGASVASILRILSKEMIVLIGLANVIAWPLAWFFMEKWLGSFAYHINMNIYTCVIAGVATALIALITVSTQTIKAAIRNPVNTLRYE